MNILFSILSAAYIAGIFLFADSPMVSDVAPVNPYSLLHIPLYGILTILLILSFSKNLTNPINLINSTKLLVSGSTALLVALARALVKDPDILVLDEPTSALDSLTEKSIFQSLPDFLQNKTLFVVAHRISTIKNSDHILLLNENHLVAIGKHESLLETNDYYRSLVSYQQCCGN